MTAPISVKYEYWVAVIDDANKAQERVKRLEAALRDIVDYDMIMLNENFVSSREKMREIARKALEE